MTSNIPSQVSSRKALVVGINKYEKGKIFPALKAPDYNAKHMKSILKQKCSFLVSDFSKPDRKQLKDEIIKLFLPNGNPPKMALFYFSGYILVKNSGLTEVFLTTSDSNPAQDDLGISLHWLREVLKCSKIEQQVVILDCCHSEGNNKLLNLDNFILDNYLNMSRFLIFSFQKSKQEFQQDGGRCSSLTKSMLIALDNQYKYGNDNAELVKYLKSNEMFLRKLGDFKRIYFGKIDNLAISNNKAESKSGEPDNTVSSHQCPYKGLSYFDSNPEDTSNFYGRDRTINQLLEKINKNNFLAVIGTAGVGKSSVIRAGLVYRLKEGLQISGSDNWYIPPVIQPGEKPLNSLAQAFVDTSLSAEEQKLQFREFIKLLDEKKENNGEKITDALEAMIDQVIKNYNKERVILVIDQFEEVFSLRKHQAPGERLGDNSEQYLFIRCLLEKLEAWSSKFSLVLAIRADFIGKCTERRYFGLAANIQQNLVAITPMDPDTLREVIVKPTEKLGVRVEEKLIDRLINDMKSVSGNLALLQYMLTKLWYHQDHQTLTLINYNNLGSLKGILNQHGNKVYQELKNQDQGAIAKTILINLVALGDGTTGYTRKKLLLENLIEICRRKNQLDNQQNISLEQIKSTIEDLQKSDLIILEEDIQENGEKKQVVTLAHEVLTQHWKKLREWVQEYRYIDIRKNQIISYAQEWDQEDIAQKASRLPSSQQLEESKVFMMQYGELLTSSDSELITRYIEAGQEKINYRNYIGNIIVITFFPFMIVLLLIISLLIYKFYKHCYCIL
ncbi:nSTAND1 domain-containing NTPase [Calothrix sp. NIES-3974]|uniref:nSTAND1 domain-containing NTPase n=1 Tax=Calothrix sp. NIES-3974 TaxID=2005462 RepID=UPI000B605D9C|nr:caspase family protein [Calothrix sp. NIES-3974]BAZ04693.1 pentapeptide repeat-containing protein [Calothrix sp. NIES-3974]